MARRMKSTAPAAAPMPIPALAPTDRPASSEAFEALASAVEDAEALVVVLVEEVV